MFRLQSAGLPKDPWFPADLKGLGYFINDEDEIRSIENPRAYFKYFLSKNERTNEVQRAAMNTAIRAEVSKRLQDIGMQTLRLPLGAQEHEPHVPILASCGIAEKKRVVIIFYEHNQDLGIFAYRVVGGHGGINAGSAVNLVKHIQSLATGPGDKESPGVILANMGQLRWWRRGKQAVTQTTWYSVPQKNAVSGNYKFDMIKNTVPGNRSTTEHLTYVFNVVVKEVLNPNVKLDLIGVSDGAVQVVEFLNKKENWDFWQSRISAIALLSPYHSLDDISNPEFAAWMQKRVRAYVNTSRPVGTPLATPLGGGNFRTGFGCYSYSLGVPYYAEMLLPKGYKAVMDWLQEVAFTPGYENPKVVISEEEERELKLGGMLGHMDSDRKDVALENSSGDTEIVEEDVAVAVEERAAGKVQVDDSKNGDFSSRDIQSEAVKLEDGIEATVKVEESAEEEVKSRSASGPEVIEAQVIELDAVEGNIINGDVIDGESIVPKMNEPRPKDEAAKAEQTSEKVLINKPTTIETQKPKPTQKLTAGIFPIRLQSLEHVEPTTPVELTLKLPPALTSSPSDRYRGVLGFEKRVNSEHTLKQVDRPFQTEKSPVEAENAAVSGVRKDMVEEWVAGDESTFTSIGCGTTGKDGDIVQIPAGGAALGGAGKGKEVEGYGGVVIGKGGWKEGDGSRAGGEALDAGGRFLRSVSFAESAGVTDVDDDEKQGSV